MPGSIRVCGRVPDFPGRLAKATGSTCQRTVLGLNPANFYPIIAMVAALGIIITAAYILRAVGKVFFGEYEGEKWHDMRPLLALDKMALVGFSFILILIGVFPAVIAPIVESGMAPVVERLQDAQQTAKYDGSTRFRLARHQFYLQWIGGGA